MTVDIRADSTEYAKATITVDKDITGDVIEVALPATGTDPTTWFTANVTGVVDNGNGKWTASYRLLLGPAGGAVTLTKGTTYDWCVKVTDNPEVPIRNTGTVTAT